MELLNRVLFAGVTVKHVLIGLVVLLAAGALFKALGGKKATSAAHLVKRRCAACGWAGEVSQFNKKCPKCGKAIEA